MLSLLTQNLEIEQTTSAALIGDYERFSSAGLPEKLEDYVREKYQIDLSSEYGGLPIRNPFGKGSGQLSLNISQVKRDADDGLGFVVLKTVIAEDEQGHQSMSEWAIQETRMVVKRCAGRDGTMGWSVTWKGRGWYDTFQKYLEFYAEALEVGQQAKMLLVPSCKYHLPRLAEGEWRTKEYEYTTRSLLDVWDKHSGINQPMPIEKDFSPTLAGSSAAAQEQTIVYWLTRVSGLIRRAAAPRSVQVGLKIFNAIFEDDFQLDILRAVNERCEKENAPDFLIYANRLFDPEREFDGIRGVAYGGPDLSARNLSIMARWRKLEADGLIPCRHLPISATGNITNGKTAVEYLLRGASSFQLHTFFQLPNSEYGMRVGSKTARALHKLYFHPEQGLVAWLIHYRRLFDWPTEWNIKQIADYCADPANLLWASSLPGGKSG